MVYVRLLDAMAAIVVRKLQAVNGQSMLCRIKEHNQHSKCSCLNLTVQCRDSVYS